jgi:FAD/FMN-containing dehydrogenase
MASTQVVTTRGARGAPRDAELAALRESLRGECFQPDDAGYDGARAVWNAMIDRHPAMVARCAGVADVIRAVTFAREQDLVVSVRGGGHNVAGTAVCDEGLVIDLSRMKGIRVDPGRRRVRAEAGALWGEVDHETQAFGLAAPGGFVSTTGIAGLTLGGGMAWLMRSCGLSCDNLISADVVTADGQLVKASATENDDLLWGLRGGGGNFGVVTSFEFRLHPVGPVVMGGVLVHPVERAGELLAFFRDFTQTAPDELTTALVLDLSPEGAPIAAIACCYNGPPEQGADVLQPLREFGPPVADLIGPMPYTQLQRMLDARYAAGRRNYWKSGFLRGLDDVAVRTLVDGYQARPSPLCHILIEHLGGAVRRADRHATAFDHRDHDYNFTALAQWMEPADDDACMRWARDLWRDMRPSLAGGVYVNYMSDHGDGREERVGVAYTPETYERLAALKAKHDPTNLFRMNHNIRPAAPTG